ncbi:hypothetical protein Krac_7313 [Ktedonobacter racemifer DSM 44963]|uniref:Uncharacterized protein n=1 Tax=Ktedonobacter racemifer DSM 44963 TaxID=485913 RepID=D6TRX4_KTERA|nr:hypothetical protein Krac_7313 [Ktedonobacter racemifer DSM 44963]
MFDNFTSVWYSRREIPYIFARGGTTWQKPRKPSGRRYTIHRSMLPTSRQTRSSSIASWPFILKSSRHTKVFLPSTIRRPSRPWRNSRIQRSPTPIQSCHSPISRQISLLCSDALLSMPRSARLAPSSPLSKHGEHGSRNTKPNKRRRARGGRSGCGHQSRPDHGRSQLPSTQAFGASVVPVLSCSKSGPARAGPGSNYTRSVAISLMVI